jgi:membrane AbrB-like protein
MVRKAGLQLLSLLGNRAIALKWVALLVLSGLFVLALEALRLPAALLLGPMAAAILLAVAGGGLRIPLHPFLVAQAVIGCMIARSIPPAIFGEIFRNWPLFLAAVLSVIAASSALGWLLTHWRVLPGTTAVWGSSPGAATAMMIMAEAYGADIRLVAFMQYLRVFLVAVLASVVSRIWVTGAGGPAATIMWFPPIAWVPFAETLALVGLGAIVAPVLRFPAGPLLLPFAVGIALQDAGLVTIELPPWLLAVSYALVGWSVGLRFTRPILVHAARAAPRILASILVLIAICGGLAVLLVAMAGVDPLTAYLAMSPGGVDSAVIIAASSQVDLPFVMAMQTTRFVLVLLIGPSLARFIARRAGAANERERTGA